MAVSRRKAKQPEGNQALPNLKLRRKVLLGCLSVAASALVGAVFYRQVLETDFLQQQGEALPARR
jgi:cell division protein FtsI (penicillin-binding protein 3)